MERQARAQSREAAARAQGLLPDPAEAVRQKKAQYAADLDAQMRAKQVREEEEEGGGEVGI